MSAFWVLLATACVLSLAGVVIRSDRASQRLAIAALPVWAAAFVLALVIGLSR